MTLQPKGEFLTVHQGTSIPVEPHRSQKFLTRSILADDDVQYKRSKIAKLKRKAKAKMQAVRSLKLSEPARQAVFEIGRSRGGQQESSLAARMKSVKPTGI
jgi:hypothetical protein